MNEIKNNTPKNHIRIVTATSLFDGHDVAINIIRRILQNTGVEVIHLGHNRSVKEIVDCAIQEDVNAIAITSYQGGHIEFLKYMYDLLQENRSEHIKIFAGGGGVILPDEIDILHTYGICRIFSPEDGRKMGLQGMVNDVINKSDFTLGKNDDTNIENLKKKNFRSIARCLTLSENNRDSIAPLLKKIKRETGKKKIPIIGITGTGGSGKSSIVDELVRRFLLDFDGKTMAILSVDPSKRKTGGALLGDRIRMNALNNSRVYMRSIALRSSNISLSKNIHHAIDITKSAGFDCVIIETPGIGQSDTQIVDYCDISVYVMTPEYGAATQLEKIDMLDFADIIVLNKFDKRGAIDALKDVTQQYVRSHQIFKKNHKELPIFGTVASQFNDPGIKKLYLQLLHILSEKCLLNLNSTKSATESNNKSFIIIPPQRTRYLSEISETIRNYNKWTENQAEIAQRLFSLHQSLELLNTSNYTESNTIRVLEDKKNELESKLDKTNKAIIENWQTKKQSYKNKYYTFCVRGEEFKIETQAESLSHLKIPKISLPKYRGWGDILKWNLRENVPGEFPFASGVYPFKRESEDPIRMFAGQGGPERTNKRFHYLSFGMPAKRLSTAFDSVTLYGEDPAVRPDIYGKIGNSGVSISCLDDMKKLYSGFNLMDPKTSVSMTINGPAPIMTSYFFNAAIDQQCELFIKSNGLEEHVSKIINDFYKKKGTIRPHYQGKLPRGNDGLGLFLLGISGDRVLPKNIYEKIKSATLQKIRGTVQADILKEDQAQNTCIYSTDFALKMMGDIQKFFIANNIRNFYSVSISGYHIAEAGANPITQLAFTLANGFTYLEYFKSRGMDIDKFAPNLSFFFSNGLDPEYSVLGRVARIIWAKALKLNYKANSRSQKLKYHIQTSGRSLHAQEIDFNDIRTTLQGLYAIYDNCNSLHTNAYDEAITTPTEESVRRAVAIQLIINYESGLTKNQNPLQGAFINEELTDMVEEAVLSEFDRITERGGVLGAMETMYQRNKIQEESLYYETLKHSGELPIIGVNTFFSSKGSPTVTPKEVIRAKRKEKEYQVSMIKELYKTYTDVAHKKRNELQKVVVENGNIFTSLMDVSKYCSIGQLTNTLFSVGGQYRRNM